MEDRRGGGRIGELRWPAAFALVPVPQSDPWLRFRPPLIEPGMRFSRTRLSDKDSRFRPREAGRSLRKLDQAQLLVQVLQGKA